MNQNCNERQFSPREIIDFYASGGAEIPDRFQKTEKRQRDEILEKHGVKVDRVSTGE